MVFGRIYEYVYNKYFKKPDEELRVIKLNIRQVFVCSNRVKTTKYTPYNFIFKNLYEQLCIPSNLYFVFIAVLQSTPQVSSTQGYPVVLLPLIIVLLFSALKDGYEDYQRYLSDNQLNNNIVQIVNLPYVTDQSKLINKADTHKGKVDNVDTGDTVDTVDTGDNVDNGDKGEMNSEGERYGFVKGALRNKVLVNKYWKDLKVGEYVFLQNKDIAPADLVLLATSEENGFAFVDASSLDGETNIKKKESIYDVYNELGSDFEHVITEVQRLLGHFKCEGPNKNLISFDGHLKYHFSQKITPVPLNTEMKKLLTSYKSKLHTHTSNLNPTLTDTHPVNTTENTTDNVDTVENTIENTVDIVENTLSSESARVRNESINDFESNSGEIRDAQVSLNNLLLRGCKLVNTQWVIGFVVYTGHDTKIYKNISKAPYKVSNLQRKMMRTTFLICVIQFVLCLIATFYNLYMHTHKVYEKYPYLSLQTRASGLYIVFVYYFSWMALTANFVPISAIVTLNAVKLIQGFFIQLDDSMYCEELKMNAKARNTMLNEELGQVKHLFSDKTGTLTCNKMEFRKFSIMGHSYGKGYTDVIRFVYAKKGIYLESEASNPNYDKESHVNLVDDTLFQELNDPSHPRHEYLVDFFFHLALNNWAIPDSSDDRIYMCPSPDELCFVNAAAFCGFRLLQRNSNFATVSVFNKIYKVKIIAQADFDYRRKCSTTIVAFHNCSNSNTIGSSNSNSNTIGSGSSSVDKTAAGGPDPVTHCRQSVSDELLNEDMSKYRIILYCKGGDNVMVSKLKEISEVDSVTLRNMKNYSVGGLRTLVFAKRELSHTEFRSWLTEYNKLKLCIEGRDEKLAECVGRLECGLELQGVTGIEDKLQDGVSECIEKLLMAGIRIWMLTGDNLDTSINIGIATNLVNMLSDRIMLDSNTLRYCDLATVIQSNVRRIDEENNISRHRCIIIDSITIELLFKGITSEHNLTNDHTELSVLFLELVRRVHSVICCRMTPYLKGAVVSFVKSRLGGITLAVGDGANDCNMIQTAHVGVGIKGREGSQAFNASDFGIGQFRFLSPLILHHGRCCYRNTSKCISYMFYKNVILIIPLFFYAYISLFSGQKIYYSLFVAIYNVVFTSVPVGIFGIVDQDYNKSLSAKYPHVYQLGQRNYYYNVVKFSGWILNAVIQSAIIFFMMTLGLGDEFSIPFSKGLIADAPTLGIMLLSAVFIIVSCKLVLETWYFTKITLLSHLISIFFFIVTVCSFSASPVYSANSVGSAFVLFTSYRFWIVLLGTLMLSMYRDYFYKVFKYSFCPHYYHHVQRVEYLKIEDPIPF
ncbi:phospholipid-translocating P-type ATPase flippase family protein [Theileria parva strain Muguga]|uniref:phospholipid-translocating P-type ATPase flippase family protein n=1 Tax=Theileria parva strain Muguga TaxID=333668 RepID=UPI001C619E1B|nr:phospholipid-translocating P-type ATPase flippase family protein [Theileria parva strain Muguga]EAN31223.2 phospholipid-translocating P-type ATPase flippase family protein [Theileria parva strain Muguga]